MEQLTIYTSSKEYPVYIGKGIRKRWKKLVEEMAGSYSKYFLIADKTVADLYLKDIQASMPDIPYYLVESGEESKSIGQFYDCQTAVLEAGLDRDACILALGGGVIGDLAGFVAATFMRGIDYIQLPTTLLAHDSSVGGKTAINHPLGKNLIGAFHQPLAVIYDIETLRSLTGNEWRSGFSEVIKHALIWNPDFYGWLKQNIKDLGNITDEQLAYLIKEGIRVKAQVVGQDEKESGLRAILNFGHTLGHAIEAELGYGRITHGEAVAIGMVFALRVSEVYYGIDYNMDEITKWFQQFGLPVAIPETLDEARLVERMKKDKKSSGGKINMILLKEIGKAEKVQIDESVLSPLLMAEFERSRSDDTRDKGSNNG
ncbi:3-dehydroquinate synthase [Pseudalkalibacillus caeni]|uniref:3-dehydroquinate synthase n=1 Tax=Exobacillus caeni TaxID=2574798 RepID=A0A5R9EXB0_9BACL|nr:3-dehydroquinate synthase [Pseudalkalibacillus caeni]TLS35912.1 3-dehydroquinate synthase [Pseudalkalibacillus caeni]